MTVEKLTFLGDVIAIVFDPDATWVAVQPVCQALGLSSQDEVRRLSEKPWAVTRWVARRDMPEWWPGEDDGRKGVAFLEVDSTLAWLVGIRPEELSGQASAKLIAYQSRLSASIRDVSPSASARVSTLAKIDALLTQARALLRDLGVHETDSESEGAVANPSSPPAATPSSAADRGEQRVVQVIRRPRPGQKPAEIEAEPAKDPTTEWEQAQALEKERMLEALKKTKWNRSEAADQIKMPRRTFYRRAKTYKIL